MGSERLRDKVPWLSERLNVKTTEAREEMQHQNTFDLALRLARIFSSLPVVLLLQSYLTEPLPPSLKLRPCLCLPHCAHLNFRLP